MVDDRHGATRPFAVVPLDRVNDAASQPPRRLRLFAAGRDAGIPAELRASLWEPR